MKAIRIFTVVLFLIINGSLHAQDIDMPKPIWYAIQSDDSTKLRLLVTKDNINTCYHAEQMNFTMLLLTTHYNAIKCAGMLTDRGADVNKICDGNLPPLLMAAQYGHLDMVKILVEHRANVKYVYKGDDDTNPGETALSYAEKGGHKDVADYLRSIKQEGPK
jgi:ankyrin repeat protein